MVVRVDLLQGQPYSIYRCQLESWWLTESNYLVVLQFPFCLPKCVRGLKVVLNNSVFQPQLSPHLLASAACDSTYSSRSNVVGCVSLITACDLTYSSRSNVLGCVSLITSVCFPFLQVLCLSHLCCLCSPPLLLSSFWGGGGFFYFYLVFLSPGEWLVNNKLLSCYRKLKSRCAQIWKFCLKNLQIPNNSQIPHLVVVLLLFHCMGATLVTWFWDTSVFQNNYLFQALEVAV